MFPNVRLLIAALLASVFALSFGFGVFAALRVNRDPLGQVPAGTAALQLTASEAAAAPATWGVPLGPGIRLSEAQTGAVATDASIVAPAGRETSPPLQDPNPWTATTIKAETSDASPVPSAERSPIATTTPAEVAPSAAEPPAPIAATPDTATVTPRGLAPAADFATQAAEDNPAAAASSVAADEPTAGATPPDAQPADVTGTVPDAAAPQANMPEKLTPTPERKAPRKVARRPTDRRVVKKRLVRPPSAAAIVRTGNGASTFQEPVFQSAPQPFEHPPAKSRRSANKTAKSTTPANPFAGPTAQ